MEVISKSRIKFILSLQHKKFRLKYDKFIVEGVKIIREVMSDHPDIIEEIYLSNPDFLPEVNEFKEKVEIHIVTPKELNQLSQMTTPPGILAVGRAVGYQPLPNDLKNRKFLYLAGIRDPGNMGTIIRTMDWFGFDHVIVSPDCVDHYNHKVIQASMGSIFRMKFTEMTWEEMLMEKGSLLVFAAHMKGDPLQTFSFPESGILVLGNESHGLETSIIDQSDKLISIPGDKSLGVESLNVASAAAIFCAYWTSSGE